MDFAWLASPSAPSYGAFRGTAFLWDATIQPRRSGCTLQRESVCGSLFCMRIGLTLRHKRYVDEKVKSGAYDSADEVVREGLRLLEAEDERLRRIAWLQAEVEKGFTGPFTPWTSKDPDRVRQIVSHHARRKR